jgi:hypothetical protein
MIMNPETSEEETLPIGDDWSTACELAVLAFILLVAIAIAMTAVDWVRRRISRIGGRPMIATGSLTARPNHMSSPPTLARPPRPARETA